MSRRPHRQRGMALLEVLVAVAILGMMSVSIWSSFQSTVKAIETAEVIQNRYQGIRQTLDRMVSEISMTYLSSNQPGDETRHFTLFDGRESFGADSLTFSSFAHLRMRKDANESEQTVIQYFLADDPQDAGRRHLYRRESRRLTGDLPEELERFVPAYVLCEDVASLEFYYWDKTTLEWREEWTTLSSDGQPDRLPERIKIELGIKDDEDEIELFTVQVPLFKHERI